MTPVPMCTHFQLVSLEVFGTSDHDHFSLQDKSDVEQDSPDDQVNNKNGQLIPYSETNGFSLELA